MISHLKSCFFSLACTGYQFSSSDLVPSAQYLCTLSPLVDIQVPGNKSYIVTLEFKQLTVKGEEEKRDGFLKAENSTKPEDITESITKDVITKEFFTKPSNINSILTVIVENRYVNLWN